MHTHNTHTTWEKPRYIVSSLNRFKNRQTDRQTKRTVRPSPVPEEKVRVDDWSMMRMLVVVPFSRRQW